MDSPNYIRQSANGNIIMDCANIPDKGFIDAVKVKDICKVKILNKQEKSNMKAGSPDIKITKITGQISYVTREQLTKNYVNANGSRIRIPFMRDNKEYLVAAPCNEEYKVIKLPNNCSGQFNGRQVKPGSYIVIPSTEQGELKREQLSVISSTVFKKMFKIPMQDSIRRALNNPRHSGSNEFKLFKNRQRAQHNNIQHNSDPHVNLQKQPINADIQSTMQQNTMHYANKQSTMYNPRTSIKQKLGNMNEQNKYKYRVTGRLVDINNKPIGFVVIEIATGQTRNLKTNELVQLCMNKLVENVMLVHNQSGKVFLKGNGCRLESLPSMII